MRKRRFLECAVSVAVVLVAIAFTEFSEPLIARQTLFVFLGAIVVSTMYGGLLPGIVALLLSAVGTAFFVIRPLSDFTMEDGGARWILFQLVALAVVLITASRRRNMVHVVESGERLRLALEVARTGVWDYARTSGQLWVSPGLLQMLGLHEYERPTYPEFLEMIHPDDRQLFAQVIERTWVDKVDYEMDFRVVRRDGETRSLAMRGRSYSAGRAESRVVGVVTDKSSNVPAVTISGRRQMKVSYEPVEA